MGIRYLHVEHHTDLVSKYVIPYFTSTDRVELRDGCLILTKESGNKDRMHQQGFPLRYVSHWWTSDSDKE